MGSSRSLRILLVDDDDAVRGVIKRILERLGHRVHACASAAEADASWSDAVQVAMIDLNLGEIGTNGLALIERAKRHYPATHFILTSGARPDLSLCGGDGLQFLKKPFSRDELIQVLKNADKPDAGSNLR